MVGELRGRGVGFGKRSGIEREGKRESDTKIGEIEEEEGGK